MLNFGNWDEKCAVTTLNSFGPANKNHENTKIQNFTNYALAHSIAITICQLLAVVSVHISVGLG